MKVLKKAKENFLKEPKTTRKGILYSIIIMLFGMMIAFLAPRYPELTKVLIENKDAIIGIVTALLSGVLVVKYGAKEDE